MKRLECDPPSAGQMTALADDLYWIRFTLPFRLNHINLYAFDTDDGWLLLDCGINTDDTAAQWKAMLDSPLSDKPIAGVIVSHHHADHIGYAGRLCKITGAPLYMGAVEHEMASWALGQSATAFGNCAAAAYDNFGLDADTVQRTRDVGNYYRSLVGDIPPVTIIESGHEFQTKAGRFTVRFDAGHSPGHMSLTDHARKIYVGVDFLLPRISPNISVSIRTPDDDALAHYFAYLNSMTGLTDDWLIISGHDWPYYGGGERATQLIEHHENRLARLLPQTNSSLVGSSLPMTTAAAMDTLFPFELTDHEVFFASCEARAHLNHLVTRGMMTRSMNEERAIFTPVAHS